MADIEYEGRRLVLERRTVYPLDKKLFVVEEVVRSSDVAFMTSPDARTLDDIAEDLREIRELWFSGQD